MMKIVFLGGSACPQCKVMKPRYEKKCTELGIEFEYVDAEEDYEAVTRYGIRSIPTVIFIRDGIEVGRGQAADQFNNIEGYAE